MLINSQTDLTVSLEGGSLTDVGGYPKYWVCKDGTILSYKAVYDNLQLVKDAITNDETIDSDPNWCVIACEINYENDYLGCDHTNTVIPSAYGGMEDSQHL